MSVSPAYCDAPPGEAAPEGNAAPPGEAAPADGGDQNGQDGNGDQEDDPGKFMRFVLGLYDGVVNGSIPGLDSVDHLADYYTQHYPNPEAAAWALGRWQNGKCAADGFLLGLPGLVLLPVTIPANVASTLAFHIQTIASIARIGGYDLRNDAIKTLVLVCLTGESANAVLKPLGLTLAQVLTKGLIINIPRSFLGRINAVVGVKLFTKFSGKGVIQLGRLVPLVGGLFGGTVDFFASKWVVSAAVDTFINNNHEE